MVLIIGVAVLGGVALGLPFGLDTSKVSALIGLAVLSGALLWAHQNRAPGVLLVFLVGLMVAGVCAIGGSQWRRDRDNAPRRDTARDALFAERGRITRASIGGVTTREEWDADGRTSVEYCGSIWFFVESGGKHHHIETERCDLTPALWRLLDERHGQGIDIVFLPEELEEDGRRSGRPRLDYRYDREMSAAALDALYARCHDPGDYACNPPGGRR